MTCHLFLDNFSWNFMTFWVVLKGWEFLKRILVSRKLKYLSLISWNIRLFWILSFAKDVFNCRELIVFSCLQFADCFNDQEFCHVEWFLCFNHYYGIFFFEKFSFKKSWCCRKHMFVFEIVSLKDLNKFDQIIFSLWLLGKRFQFAIMERVWKLFHFWVLTFFLF